MPGGTTSAYHSHFPLLSKMNQPTLVIVDVSEEALMKSILGFSNARDTISLYQALQCSTQDGLLGYKTSLGELIGDYLPHKFVEIFFGMMTVARGSEDPTINNLYHNLRRGYDFCKPHDRHTRNGSLVESFQECFGQLPYALYSYCHCLVVRHPGIKLQARHILWASWELKQHRRNSEMAMMGTENVPMFLQAESSIIMKHHANDLIKKFAELFDETRGVPLDKTGKADLSLATSQVMGPYDVKFSAFYLLNASLNLRVIVSIPDNKIVDVNTTIVEPHLARVRCLYNKQLMRTLAGREKAIVVSGSNSRNLEFVSGNSLISYDRNAIIRHSIHNEVCRLEEICEFFCRFRAINCSSNFSLYNQGALVGLHHMYYVKAVAYFANQLELGSCSHS